MNVAPQVEPDFVVRSLADADLDALLPIHRAAFAGSMGVELGPRYLRAFLGWYASQRDAVALVATARGAIAGYVFGAPQGHGPRVTRDLLREIALGVATHPRAWRHPNVGLQIKHRVRGLVMPASVPTDGYGPETFNLVGIGTEPSYRKRGVAGLLLDEYERRVFQRPFERINLHVYSDNAAARALYAKRGWIVGLDGGRVLTLEKRRG